MNNEYDETHMEIWQKGSAEPVLLTPLTYPDAMALRAKLYRLRKKLLQDGHPTGKLAKLTTIKLYPTMGANSSQIFNLMIHPSNMGFEEAFKNAGIARDEPPPLE